MNTHETTEELKRVIVWEKWRDPLGGDAGEAEFPGAFGTFETDHITQKIIHDYDESDDEDNDDTYDDGYSEEKRSPNLPPKRLGFGILTTPMGIIPVTEHTRAGSIFNFWTAHSNFRITKEIVDIVEDTDGVETLDIFTPYRWRIAIGKAFHSQEVKDQISKNLNAKPNEA